MDFRITKKLLTFLLNVMDELRDEDFDKKNKSRIITEGNGILTEIFNYQFKYQFSLYSRETLGIISKFPLDEVPFELLEKIVRNIDSKRDLFNLSLVSKKFNAACIGPLYSEISTSLSKNYWKGANFALLCLGSKSRNSYSKNVDFWNRPSILRYSFLPEQWAVGDQLQNLLVPFPISMQFYFTSLQHFEICESNLNQRY